MATKKIVITDEPEEVEESAPSQDSEAAVDESTDEADSSADTSAEQSDEEQPIENPAPESPVQVEQETPAPPQRETSLNASKPKRFNVGRKAIIAGLIAIVVIAGVYVFANRNYSDPIPTSVTKQTGFKVYYPQSSNNAYTLAPNSANYADGKLSYSVTLKNTHSNGANPFVHVSETKLVGKGPDLNSIPNFTVFNAPAGKAAISPDGQVVNGVLVTNKSLVIVNGLGGVSRQDLMQLIKSM